MSPFLENLLLFGRLLRGLGLAVNPGRMMDLVNALAFIEVGQRTDFYHAARSLLVHRREDLPLFDQAFALFWRKSPEGYRVEMPSHLAQLPKDKPLVLPPALQEDSASTPADESEPPLWVVEVTRTYSAQEVLRRKDFSLLTGEELTAIQQLMANLAWQLGQRRTRRTQAGAGARLDVRHTLRHALRHGGEILTWSQRTPKFKPRPLILLADISGSMERYTRLLLHFIYGLTRSLHQPVESFVFGTRLTRITRPLQLRSVEAALHEVSYAVSDWAGGTRIGESLKAFNYIWARRVLGRGAVVLIISDGWDRGDPQLLGHEMARLQRSCHRLIWLNPLLGAPDYQPLTRGIQAALPYIDDFLPVHNLASLENLAAHLQQL